MYMENEDNTWALKFLWKKGFFIYFSDHFWAFFDMLFRRQEKNQIEAK